MIVTTVLEIVFGAVYYHNEAEPLPANFLILILFNKLSEIGILTSVATIFLVQFSILRYPKNHGIFLIITFVMISGYLFALTSIDNEQTTSYQTPASPSPGEILIHSSDGIFIQNKDGQIYRDIVHADPDQENTLRYYSQGSYDPQNGKMLVHSENSEANKELQVGSLYNRLDKPPILASISRDIQHLVNLTSNIKNKFSLQSLFLIFSITFFCISCWLLVKLTKWPLINFFLVLLAGRFLFFIYSLFNNRHVLNFFNNILYEKYLAYLPAFFLFFFGSLLIIISLLLPSASQWKKRVPYE